ncbi:hypothetical protein LSAT2_021405 [Lamellibrachia satsuma]|nr:hypothetical protein LSAT2_021405 [Lamellibrachia satsuma]
MEAVSDCKEGICAVDCRHTGSIRVQPLPIMRVILAFVFLLVLSDVGVDCEDEDASLFLLCINACRVRTMLCLRRLCGRMYDKKAHKKCDELRMNCLMGCESRYG